MKPIKRAVKKKAAAATAFFMVWPALFGFIAAAAADEPAAEAGLSSLSLSAGELTPAFSEQVTAYTAHVGHDVSEVR